jgi:hypothetical protein
MQPRRVYANGFRLVRRSLLAVCLTVVTASSGVLEAVDFEKDVRPLLAARCFQCHGTAKQKGGLRLSDRARAFQGGDSGKAIVPRKASESLLLHLVKGADPDRVMPPKGERLKPAEIAVLEEWINSGAEWPESVRADAERVPSEHWAYRPLERPQEPAVRTESWVRSPLDRFVLARLEKEGLEPSPEADGHTLIRRLSYDLLGLPPTLEEADAFARDVEPGAYERLVDRLLESKHFGERWGRHWLDKARYADSDGYEKDRPRPRAWRYRDWVIDAVNRDKPFDEFTIEQLAGDLLPEASAEQILATAFHRQTLTNTEGGADQEEFRVAAIIDRVNTTSTVWLGLTAACAQCHTHKYDAITQREYYELFAFFNNTDEQNTRVPVSREEWSQYEAELDEWAKADAALQERFDARKAVVGDDFRTWAADLREMLSDKGSVQYRTLLAESVQAEAGKAEEGETTFTRLDDGSYLVAGANPENAKYTVLVRATELKDVRGFRLQALPHESLKKGLGRSESGEFAVTEVKLYHYEDGTLDPGSAKPIEVESARASAAEEGWPAAAVFDGNTKTGWAPGPQDGKAQELVLLTKKPYFNGRPDYFALVIEQRRGEHRALGRFRVSAVTGDPDVIRLPPAIRDALAEGSSSEAADSVRTYYTSTRDKAGSAVHAELLAHAEKRPKAPEMEVQVLGERAQERRTTRILHRGDFLQPKDEVSPGTLAVLHSLQPNAELPSQSPNRLDLARWLVSPENPLTGRVTANHMWKYLFGRALVGTLNDFGVRGEIPSHPDLLDWLATEYPRLGWSRKQMIRTIVHSATYRQSSRHHPELSDVDPENRLLYRQNRFRVEAEIVRDLALTVSGLLQPKIGGPSVFPPMPPKIAALSYASNFKWKTSTGGDQYRRGMYTFFKRTVPHPTLVTFDCPDANTTCAERQTSNTPLQALATLNNQVFAEAAQALAARVLRAELASDSERLRYLFRICLVRTPEPAEETELLDLLRQNRAWYEKNPADSKALVSLHSPQNAHDFEAAAWTATARIVINLDEFITRE